MPYALSSLQAIAQDKGRFSKGKARTLQTVATKPPKFLSEDARGLHRGSSREQSATISNGLLPKERVVSMATEKERLLRVLKDKRITGQGLRIVLLLAVSTEYGWYSPLTPAQIARLLELHESSVKRSIRDLVEDGILRKRYESGKLVGYEILLFADEAG